MFERNKYFRITLSCHLNVMLTVKTAFQISQIL